MKNSTLTEINKKEQLSTNGGTVPFPWPMFLPDPMLRDDRVMPWQFPILKTKFKSISNKNK